MAEDVANQKRSSETLGRRASIVMMQEVSAEGDPPQSASTSPSTGVLNPAVRNRTGKPSTEKGKLVDPYYTKDAQVRKKPSSPNISPMDRASRPNVNKRSSSQLSQRTSTRSTNENDVRDQIRKRISYENASLNSKTTPSTVARQREIQRKMRKEKAEVEAKYESSAHNSSVRRGSEQEDLFPMQGKAGSKTSRSNIPPDNKKSDRFTLVSSNRRSKSTLPAPLSNKRTSKTNQMLQSMTGIGDDYRSGGLPLAQNQNSEMDGFEDADLRSNIVHKTSDDSLYNCSEFSLSTTDYLDIDERNSSQSRYFPKISDISPMNFTESFRFSYFAIPGHIRENNDKIKKGWFKLPKLPALVFKNKGRRRIKSNLLRRIEKLDQIAV